MIFSIAMTEVVDDDLRAHLVRSDKQEDLCFALYHPSTGRERFSALVDAVILPLEGERNVHGNASFQPEYLERVLDEATKVKAGIALLHSHPRATSWQGMSNDDFDAESGMAGAVYAATKLPLIGLTLSGMSGFWSGRHWHRVAPRTWWHTDCETVRVVGQVLAPHFCPSLKPEFEIPHALMRTTHAWGDRVQQQLARLRIGIVGLGSVGLLVAETLARMGMTEVVGIDFDVFKEHNRDRSLHAYPEDVAISELKVMLAARASIRSATMPGFTFEALALGIQDLGAYRRALDCDVIFSCVDRPWARSILNHLSYANLIPVIDGGIAVERLRSGGLRSADWGVFVVGPGRRCLSCAGQFDVAHVALEQNGELDDPEYIKGLPKDNPLKKNENVFVFSMALAAQEVLKLIQLVNAPAGVNAPAEERYVYPAGHLESEPNAVCDPYCSYRDKSGQGDDAGHPGTAGWT